jgi:2-polyprenyl-3-methyl-5-hydroxy-6-metoxy-1,4-benzoquinol methylase
MQLVKSPITDSLNVVKIESIESKLIIDLYLSDYKLDVSRYFKNLNSVDIYKCLDTGFRFYSPSSTSGDELFYSDFQEVLGNYYKPIRWEYKYALNIIKPTDKVLEIGTGSGIFFEMLSKKAKNPTGLELSNRAIEEANKKGFNIKNQLIEDHSLEFENQYDIVCFFQVLEHITDVKSFLDAAVKCLKPGGKLIFAVPNNNPYIYRYLKLYTSNLPPHHAGLWDENSIKSLKDHFEINLVKVVVEPLFGIHYQLKLWAVEKKMFIVEKALANMPILFIKILGKFGYLFKGVNVLGLFEKKQ